MTVTNNIDQKQIKYHVFNAVTNSELTELVPVFTIRPEFPTSVKKVNTSFKNVCRTWGPTLLADLMIFCPLGPTNFKNSVKEKEPSLSVDCCFSAVILNYPCSSNQVNIYACVKGVRLQLYGSLLFIF